MINLGDALTIVGLFIDVVGAVTIAIPDIPQIKQYHKGGRVNRQLRYLQQGATASTGKGFKDLCDLLEDYYEEPIPENIRALRVQEGKQDNRFNNLILGLDNGQNTYI